MMQMLLLSVIIRNTHIRNEKHPTEKLSGAFTIY